MKHCSTINVNSLNQHIQPYNALGAKHERQTQTTCYNMISSNIRNSSLGSEEVVIILSINKNAAVMQQNTM